jgi:hypothetical protein
LADLPKDSIQLHYVLLANAFATMMTFDRAILDDIEANLRALYIDEIKRRLQAADGTVLLDETSNDLLIGMAFLRAFKLALIITGTTVILYDGDETLEAVFAFMRTAPQGLPNTSPSASTTTHEVDDE